MTHIRFALVSAILLIPVAARADEGDAGAGAEPDGAAKQAEEEQVSIAFKDVPIEKICTFIGQKLGKPVIPHEKVKGKKITIIHSRNEPLSKALQVVANALRQNGVIIQHYPGHIEFLPISEAGKSRRRVIGPDESLDDIEDRTQIVQKVFDVQHYDVLKLMKVVSPMLPEYGSVFADPNVRKLIVTDTVANLARIEDIIARLDVSIADETIERIFRIKHGDASDIVSIVRALIEGTLGSKGKDVVTGGKAKGENAVFIEHSKTPVMLMADVTRNSIIAVAPVQIMTQIEKYVHQLDVREEAEQPFDVLSVKFADMNELSRQIAQIVSSHPNEDIKKSLRVVPFEQLQKLLVFGSRSGRAFVRDLLVQLDVDTSANRVIRQFRLRHVDAERVAEKIENLYSTRVLVSSGGWRGNRYSQSGPQRVKVTFDTYDNSVSVFTDPINIKHVEKLIVEWDVPPDLEEAQPKVYHLEYADPVKVQDILEKMYTRQRQTSGSPWWPTVRENAPVGRLFGQFSFEALEDSNILIVSTTTVANYKVIDGIIEELDQPQDAHLPMVLELKHANAEDLAEQLNAMFSERGTLAEVSRSRRELSYRDRSAAPQAGPAPGQRNEQEQTDPGKLKLWWEKGSHPANQRRASNLIGRPRIVPVHRQNALLIMAPPAYQLPIRDLVEKLDLPGEQVVIRAIVIEVRHDDTMTVGMRIASDPAILSDPRLTDQAIGGGSSVDYTRLFDGDRGVLDANMSVNVLIQMLDRKFNLSVLRHPMLYTADNQEATFFDGQDVPFSSGTTFTGERQNESVGYRPVGTTLQVRPHITNKGDVDLRIDLELSRISQGETVLGNLLFDSIRTTTRNIVLNGQTVMLSGIVRQEQFEDRRKIPIMGDVPLLGPLFQSNDTRDANRELIIFITPHIVREEADADRIMEREKQKLESLQKQLRGEGEEQ